MTPAIRIENLGKKYRVTQGKPRDGYRTLRESLVEAAGAPLRRLRRGFTADNPAEDFWALKDVSFDVQPGEVVGIIGRNGAGKSTLLKILSRITRPTTGRVELNGRVGSLLEVGTGFHPELTGRENVYLNGSILGMTRRVIDRKFDEIVAFSGVEAFLDTPVKRYSSGMYVRLAFAVAAYLDPEILIVDEVLAVGDAEFQKRCLAKMRSVTQTGKTVLLVSHNLSLMDSLCDRVLTLSSGRAIGFGAASEQVENYVRGCHSGQVANINLRDHPNRVEGVTPLLSGLTIRVNGQPGTVVRMGEAFEFEIAFQLPRKANDIRLGIVLEDVYQTKVTAVSPTFQDPHLLDDAPMTGVVRAFIPTHNLVAGFYYVNVFAQAEGLADAVKPAGHLEIEARDVFGTGSVPDASMALTYQPCEWSTSWSKVHKS